MVGQMTIRHANEGQREQRTLYGEFLAVPLAALVLALPAIVNGYPLVFYDTADYIAMAATHEPVIYRTMPYSVLVMPAGLGISLWPVVALQALATAWVLDQARRMLAPGRSPWLVPVVAALLCLLTALPWYVGQIMPDFLTGLLALCLALVAFGGADLAPWRRAVLAVIALVAAACHASLTAMAILAAGVAVVLWLLLRRRRPEWTPRPALPVAIAIAGVLTVGLVHFAATGSFYYSRSGDVFLLARAMQDGLVKKYLDEVCPSPDYKLCQFKDRLPRTANDYLWEYGSILGDVGGWEHSGPESRRIVIGSLLRFPLAHLRAALADGAEQFVSFRSGDGTWPQTGYTAAAIERFYPQDVEAYTASLQQRGRLDFRRMNQIHVPAAVVGVIGLAVLGWMAWRRGDIAGARFAVAILFFLVANAFICGALSNPGDRYQSRIVWIALFADFLLSLRLAPMLAGQPAANRVK